MENYDKKVLDLAMEAGRILLDAGAEIFRVEETISKIATAFGIEKCSSFVMSTGIFLTAENEGGEIYASVKHIPIRKAKLHRIAAVNQLSREIVEGKYSLEEAEAELERIKAIPDKKLWEVFLASGVGPGGFCYLLGGGAAEVVAAFLSGVFLRCILLAIERRKKTTSKVVENLIGGFCLSLFAIIFYRMGIGESPGKILVGSVMLLVPGVSLVNAVRDFAEGNYIGGGVRFLDAVMVALGIALGVGMMYILYFRLTGETIVWL